jgi:hypothetical protein
MFDGDFHKKVLDRLDLIVKFMTPKPAGVIIVNKKTKETIMSTVNLKQGQSVPVALHYVDAAGNDLGAVPASDNPSFSVSDPSALTFKDGAVFNTNSGTGDVTETLTGSAKGFSDTATIVCAGVGAPANQPAGVKLVFGTV